MQENLLGDSSFSIKRYTNLLKDLSLQKITPKSSESFSLN
jgi:hypothetical protein